MIDSAALNNNPIHLWLCQPEAVSDSRLLAAYTTLLNHHERQRWQRFRFDQHRHQFLIARALVRTTLSRYAPLAPGQWRFIYNRYGRPQIDPASAVKVPDLRFNLSHTEGLIVCAVTRGCDIGVDIENIQRNSPTLAIAKRFFSAQEYSDLMHCVEADRPNRFFDYWTLKEAYIKARGMGLALPLGGFSFKLGADAHSISVEFSPAINDHTDRWQFWLHSPTQQHRLGLCVEQRLKRAQVSYQTAITDGITVKTVVPLAPD